MADYLLAATSLADVQYLERPNPLNHTYQPMKLYLLRDVGSMPLLHYDA